MMRLNYRLSSLSTSNQNFIWRQSPPPGILLRAVRCEGFQAADCSHLKREKERNRFPWDGRLVVVIRSRFPVYYYVSSPPFSPRRLYNYNTSNWCFNSSGQHRQVNVRLLTEIRSRSGLLQISLSCQPPHCPFICLIFYPSMQERQPFYQDTF